MVDWIARDLGQAPLRNTTSVCASDATPVALSIVIPAYNESARIESTVTETLSYFGDRNESATLVHRIQATSSRVQIISLDRNRGKGAAVRRGVLDAKGEWILFMDADLATPLDQFEKLMMPVRRGASLTIGTRAHAASDIRERQSRPREMMGKTFNVMVRALRLGNVHDTQCGFKLFTRAVAQDLFAHQTLDGFAFDVEILWLARQRGYTIEEVPVAWYHREASKVSPVWDAAHMAVELFALRTTATTHTIRHQLSRVLRMPSRVGPAARR